MQQSYILLLFLSLLTIFTPVSAQTDGDGEPARILDQIDLDQFNSQAYIRLLEILDDLHWSEQRHNLIFNSDYDWQKDQIQYSARYRFRFNHNDNQWQAGMIWKDGIKAYASLTRNTGWLRQAIIGHYRVNLGVGLLCHQGFSLGKAVSTTSFYQKHATLSPHASSSDEDYMQGVAIRMHMGQWEITPFISSRDTEEQTGWMTNLGTRLRWMSEWYEIAGNVLYTQYQHDRVPHPTRYNSRYFRGHELWQGSIDYEARLFDMHFKGETAMDDAGGWATVDALQYTMLEHWHLTALYRQYSDNYRQILANSLAEGSGMQGERGETITLEGSLSQHWSLYLAADWFHFSTPQYGIFQPSEGYELTARGNYNRSGSRHNWKGSIQYRLKAKYRNDTSTKAPTDIIPYYRHSIDAHLQWLPSSGLYLKAQAHSRFYSDFRQRGVQCGYAFSQALGWNALHLPLKAEIQGTWFRTDSYDCRLYLSEKNVLYGFSIPMLNGEGVRLTATLHYQLFNHLTIEAKYGHMAYRDGSLRDHFWLQGVVPF